MADFKKVFLCRCLPPQDDAFYKLTESERKEIVSQSFIENISRVVGQNNPQYNEAMKKIEIVHPEYLKMRPFNECFLLIENSEYLLIDYIKNILSRAIHSKYVFTLNLSKAGFKDVLKHMINKLSSEDFFVHINLNNSNYQSYISSLL